MKTYHDYVGLKRTKVGDEFEANLESLDRMGSFIIPEVFSAEELKNIRKKNGSDLGETTRTIRG